MIQPPNPRLRHILQLASDPDASLHRISQLVAEIPGLNTDLLRYANSASLGLGRELQDTGKVILLSGISCVQNLTLCYTLVHALPRGEETDTLLQPFWESALRRATFARRLARFQPQVSPEFAFVLGLSLELGSLLQALEKTGSPVLPRELRACAGEARREKEIELYGSGREVALVEEVTSWSFPKPLLKAVSGYHLRQTPEERLLGWADRLAELFTLTDPLSALDPCLEMLRVEAKLSAQEVYEILEESDRRVAEFAALLKIPLGRIEPWSDVRHRCQAARPVEELSSAELKDLVKGLREERDALVKERDILQEETVKLVNLDRLTNTVNRKRYLEALRRELGRSQRLNRPLSLVLVDIDGFSTINRRYGESVGDEILKRVSGLLTRIARDPEAVARIGADDFAILLPETTASSGRLFAERIRAALESMKLDFKEQRIRISGTVVGISLDTLPIEKPDHEQFHNFALQALENIRANGTNQAAWAA